jgi:hypothetical protein
MRHAVVPMLCVLGGLLTTRAFAAQPPWELEPAPSVIEDRVRMEIGVFGANFDTTVRVDPSPQQVGTTINAEDDLALASRKVLPDLELTLFAGDRHFFRLSGLNLRRNAQHVLDRTIVFDNNTYRLGERVDSNLDITMAGITYGYRFIRAKHLELDGTFGIQVGSVDVNATVPTTLRQSDSASGPIPLLGLEGRYEISRRWALEARAQYLRVIVSDVRGAILDARYAAMWRANPHLCFGLGYRIFRIDADSKTTSHPGVVDLKIAGPLLFTQASL